MVDRLVSVDDNFELPAPTTSRLRESFNLAQIEADLEAVRAELELRRLRVDARNLATDPSFEADLLAGVAPGDPFMGGYFVGVIDTTRPGSIVASDASQVGLRYALIVAPASLENTSRQWKTTANAAPAAARTRWDGLSATQAMNTAEYPAAQYCAGLSYPSDGGSPWYLPAMDELELIYRNLKATTEANYTNTFISDAGSFPYAGGTVNRGYNPSSDPAGAAYTSTVPGQTAAPAFRDGGGQDLGDGGTAFHYWSSTEYNTSLTWYQTFSGSSAGYQGNSNKTNANRVRPVRRVLVSNNSWSISGTRSLHIPDGGTWTRPLAAASTVVVTARNPGQVLTVGTATDTSIGTDEELRAFGDTAVTLGPGWWDDLAIVEGIYDGPYFDGDTPPDDTYTYRWTGPEHASRSERLVVNPEVPE